MNNPRPTHYDTINSCIQRRINSAIRSVLFKTKAALQSLKNELKSKDKMVEDLYKLIIRERKEREQEQLVFEQRIEENRIRDKPERNNEHKLLVTEILNTQVNLDPEKVKDENPAIPIKEIKLLEQEPERGVVETIVFPHHLTSYLIFLSREKDKIHNPKRKQLSHNESKRNYNYRESYRNSRKSNLREMESFQRRPPNRHHDAINSNNNRTMNCNNLNLEDNLEYYNLTSDKKFESPKDSPLTEYGSRHIKRKGRKRYRKKKSTSAIVMITCIWDI